MTPQARVSLAINVAAVADSGYFDDTRVIIDAVKDPVDSDSDSIQVHCAELNTWGRGLDARSTIARSNHCSKGLGSASSSFLAEGLMRI